MTYAYRSTQIGIAASPTGELLIVKSIAGKSLAKGDSADVSDTTQTTSTALYCGWKTVTSVPVRLTPLIYLDMPSRIKRGSRVLRALMKLYVCDSDFPSDVVPANNTVELWAIRRTLSNTLALATWTNYASGAPWDELGIKYAVGNDTDGTLIDSFTWTQDDHDLAPTFTAAVVKELTLTDEFQRLLDFDEPIRLALRAKWATAATQATINVDLPSDATQKTRPHTYFDLRYKYPLEVYGATPGGTYDPGNLKDVNSTGTEQHLFLGTPPRGSSTAAQKFFVRNELTAAQPAVVFEGGYSQIGSIDQTHVVGSGRRRYITIYNTDGTHQTPSGTWRLVFSAATTYDVKFTPDGSTTEASVVTGKSTASNESITYNALTALLINSDGWTGTFAAADYVSFETRGDLHSTAYPLSNLDDVYVAPHAAADRTTAYTTKRRHLGRATTQQLYGEDTSVIANSGGATGVIATVTDGGTFTHIKLPDTSRYTADGYATLATYDASDETVGTARVEQVQIKTVYALGDATYPGQIRLYETVATPGDFDSTSIFTTGVWLGRLEAPAQGLLAATASVSSANIIVSATPTRTSGVITLFDPDSGTSETKTIDFVVGTTITLTAAPSYAYPVGSEYFFNDETTSNMPFFVTAEPTTSNPRGRKLGYGSAISIAIV